MDLAYYSFYKDAGNLWHIESISVRASFVTMPDWYIETSSSSKKTFKGSKSSTTQRIVYVERGVTQKDIQDMLFLSVPDLTGIRKNLMIAENEF
jgi:hypothetical protein